MRDNIATVRTTRCDADLRMRECDEMRTTANCGDTAALYRVEIRDCRRDIKLWQCYKMIKRFKLQK